MHPICPGSAMAASTRYRTQAATSEMAPTRSAPLSALTNVRPNPEEPRTFGAKTAMPQATSDWNSAL